MIDPANEESSGIEQDDGVGHQWTSQYVREMRALLGQDVCRQLAIYELPNNFVLSVIVPVFNESKTVRSVIDRLRATGIPMQIVVVDDGSIDGTAEAIAPLQNDEDVRVLRHPKNRGKGAAIRSAVPETSGSVIVIQDADQEYDPGDFRRLLQPIIADDADVVFGTRYASGDRQLSPWWHQAVNGFITLLASLAIGRRFSDIETCYKMARRECFVDVLDHLQENRFGIEIEITARWARNNLRFVERPIRYRHRWYDEGKKIGWRDGIRALWCVGKYGLLRR